MCICGQQTAKLLVLVDAIPRLCWIIEVGCSNHFYRSCSSHNNQHRRSCTCRSERKLLSFAWPLGPLGVESYKRSEVISQPAALPPIHMCRGKRVVTAPLSLGTKPPGCSGPICSLAAPRNSSTAGPEYLDLRL